MKNPLSLSPLLSQRISVHRSLGFEAEISCKPPNFSQLTNLRHHEPFFGHWALRKGIKPSRCILNSEMEEKIPSFVVNFESCKGGMSDRQVQEPIARLLPDYRISPIRGGLVKIISTTSQVRKRNAFSAYMKANYHQVEGDGQPKKIQKIGVYSCVSWNRVVSYLNW